MSFKPCTEKIKKKKLEFVRFYVESGSVSRTRPGSIIPEADQRIRIRKKMIRIRNTEKGTNYLLKIVKKRGEGFWNSSVPGAGRRGGR